MIFKSVASFLVLSGSICLGQSFIGADAPSAPTSVPKVPVSFDLSAIDKTVDPCVDFYAFACGNWKKDNPIPADQARWGRLTNSANTTITLLYADLKAAADAPKTPLQKKYGDYFAACMNSELANQLGAKPLEPALKTIAEWNDKKTVATLLSQMNAKFALQFFFSFESDQDQKDSTRQIGEIDQAGLGLPDRDYYLERRSARRSSATQYIEHMTKMFVLLQAIRRSRPPPKPRTSWRSRRRWPKAP